MVETQGAPTPDNTLMNGAENPNLANTLENGAEEVEGNFHGMEKQADDMGGSEMEEFKGLESPQGANASEWLCDLLSTKLQKFFWDNIEPLCDHIGMGAKLAIASHQERKQNRAERLEERERNRQERERREQTPPETPRTETQERTPEVEPNTPEPQPKVDDNYKVAPNDGPVPLSGEQKNMSKAERAAHGEQRMFDRIEASQKNDPNYKGSAQEAKDFAELEKRGKLADKLKREEEAAKKNVGPKDGPVPLSGEQKNMSKAERAAHGEQRMFDRIEASQKNDPKYKGSAQEAKDFAELEKRGKLADKLRKEEAAKKTETKTDKKAKDSKEGPKKNKTKGDRTNRGKGRKNAKQAAKKAKQQPGKKKTKVDLKGAASVTKDNKAKKTALVKTAETKGKSKKGKQAQVKSLNASKKQLRNIMKNNNQNRSQTQSRGTQMANRAAEAKTGGR